MSLRTTSPAVRIGAVSYLNSKPLVYGLAELAPWAEVALDVPSRLADGLESGLYDVALIPSAAYFQNPAYRIVSDACIGCWGPVWSVKIFSRTPLPEIGTLALDEGSRTSVVLAQILLAERFGVRPRLSAFPLDAAAEDLMTDAVLMIGDRSMHGPPPTYAYQWDLGQQWREWSGLPFVFAMWVARAGFDHPLIADALNRARDAGVARLAEIARDEHRWAGITEDQCHRYLAQNLHFYMGPQEQRGLDLFHQLAVREGLVPPLPGPMATSPR